MRITFGMRRVILAGWHGLRHGGPPVDPVGQLAEVIDHGSRSLPFLTYWYFASSPIIQAPNPLA